MKAPFLRFSFILLWSYWSLVDVTINALVPMLFNVRSGHLRTINVMILFFVRNPIDPIFRRYERKKKSHWNCISRSSPFVWLRKDQYLHKYVCVFEARVNKPNKTDTVHDVDHSTWRSHTCFFDLSLFEFWRWPLVCLYSSEVGNNTPSVDICHYGKIYSHYSEEARRLWINKTLHLFHVWQVRRDQVIQFRRINNEPGLFLYQ